MARFNQTSASTAKARARRSGGDIENLAGGRAFSLSAKEELVSLLLTSFMNDQFYRSGAEGQAKLADLIERCDPLFVAKAAIYARNKFGMRSVSHVVAGELARKISGSTWGSDFFNSVVYRPDDMLEIVGYFKKYMTKKTIQTKGGGTKEVYRSMPNSMKRGLRRAFARFDGYQLGKYRGEGKEFTMVDLVNLLSPKPTVKNAEALAALVKNTLRAEGTWETALTRAGQVAKDEEDLSNLKAQAWNGLIKERKLGYMALVRNLRNIVTQAPDAVDEAIKMLTDEKLIVNSKLFPYRFYSAYVELDDVLTGRIRERVLSALAAALDIACQNVPVLEGKTLVVVDCSGSMIGNQLSQKSRMDAASVAALMAIMVKRRNPSADVMMFSDSASYCTVDVDTNALSFVKSFVRKFRYGGTNFHSIFQKANKAYDRIIILSDMQGWVGYSAPVGRGGTFETYCKQYGCKPFVYSIDLCGYGSAQFNTDSENVFLMAGFSDKIFDTMKLCETDKQAMINEIERVEFSK